MTFMITQGHWLKPLKSHCGKPNYTLSGKTVLGCYTFWSDVVVTF